MLNLFHAVMLRHGSIDVHSDSSIFQIQLKIKTADLLYNILHIIHYAAFNNSVSLTSFCWLKLISAVGAKHFGFSLMIPLKLKSCGVQVV